MPTASASYTWDEAVGEFLIYLSAHRAPKTERFYAIQLRQLVKWADENAVPFDGFGKRHMDRYLAERRKTVAPTTLRGDGVCAKSFLKWCARNDLIERSPLAEYQVRSAPKPARYMPSDEEVIALLKAIGDYWNPETNPDVRYLPAVKRLFHRTRNYAVLLLLIDSACRIGEALSLKVDDYRGGELQITIRQSKGREPRTLPLCTEAAQAIDAWLKVRERIMRDASPGEDEGWLFVSEFGTKIEESRFLKNVKAYIRFVNLPEGITLHSLRRFSLNKLAKHNLLGAQAIAGHKDTKTTLLYTKLDAGFVRDVHTQVGVLSGVLQSKQARRKKLV